VSEREPAVRSTAMFGGPGSLIALAHSQAARPAVDESCERCHEAVSYTAVTCNESEVVSEREKRPIEPRGGTVAPYIDRYDNGRTFFYLLYDGNSLNFIHKGIVGEYICLVQMEIIVAFHEIASGLARMRCIDEVSTEKRRDIARLWEEARGHGHAHASLTRSQGPWAHDPP
jgi:hypothetical protein